MATRCAFQFFNYPTFLPVPFVFAVSRFCHLLPRPRESNGPKAFFLSFSSIFRTKLDTTWTSLTALVLNSHLPSVQKKTWGWRWSPGLRMSFPPVVFWTRASQPLLVWGRGAWASVLLCIIFSHLEFLPQIRNFCFHVLLRQFLLLLYVRTACVL